jgi:hypothetical protein
VLLDFFRILVVLMLCAHGISHVIWFMAAWTRVDVGVGGGSWILPGTITIRSPIGRVLGLIALVVVIVFVVAAVALLLQLPGWRGIANVGVILSYVAVLPWMRQSPGSWAHTSVAANIVLMFLLALPVSVELSGGTV